MANSRQPPRGKTWRKIFSEIDSTILVFVLSISLGMFLHPETQAHHAKEYIITESYSTTHEKEVGIINEFDYFEPDTGSPSEDTWEYTPTLLYGITDHLMSNFHFHLKDVKGVDPFIEALTLGLQYRLMERGELPVDMGLSVDYEYPTPRSEDVLEGQDVLTVTGIFSKQFWHRRIDVTTNLFFSKSVVLGESSEVGWRVGIKGPAILPLRRLLDAGIEFEGTFDFGNDPRVEATPGVYMHLKGENVLKAGMGVGLTEEADDLSFRAAFIHLFGQ